MAIYHGVSLELREEGGNPVTTVSTAVIGLVGTTELSKINGVSIPEEGMFLVCTSGAWAKQNLTPKNQPITPLGPVSRSRRPIAPMGAGKESGLSEFRKNSLLYALDGIFDQTTTIVVCYVVPNALTTGENPVFDEAKTMAAVVNAISNLENAQAEVGYRPRILLAPGFSDIDKNNTIATKLEEMAGDKKLKAIALHDLKDPITASNAITKPPVESRRVYALWPNVLVASDDPLVLREEPLSPRVAGVIARSDNDRGWWWSPSNLQINGIVKTVKPIAFSFGEETCLANRLNDSKITTVIRQDGWRLWGNRTTAAENDPYSFLVVRRTADVICDSILTSHLWAVDRNINKNYLDDVVESNNNYLRSLKALGAIMGGKCWVDPEKNPRDNIKQGKVVFDFDFTANYPAENVHFDAHMVDDYIKEIFK
jgi:phage tail sheath protein FI